MTERAHVGVLCLCVGAGAVTLRVLDLFSGRALIESMNL